MEAHPAAEQQSGSRIRTPRAFLRRAGDDRLVALVHDGHPAAFEVLYERIAPGLLAYCRQLLGNTADAEDAIQHSFAAAHQQIQGDASLRVRPWLYTVARNRSVSILRGRREEPLENAPEPATAGLPEVVQRNQELRDVLGDVARLPEDQRSALVLSELGDLSHSDIAGVLDCEQQKVKALVFQARTALMTSRRARETDCSSIREQLATLTGGALRRREIREHLRTCEGCREYRDEVRRQRRALAVALPVVPSAALRDAVLGSVGAGGGIGGAAALAGGAGGSAIGAKALAGLALAGAAAGGIGLAVGAGQGDSHRQANPPAADTVQDPGGGTASGVAGDAKSQGDGGGAGHGNRSRHGDGRARGHRRDRGRGHGQGRSGHPGTPASPAVNPPPPVAGSGGGQGVGSQGGAGSQASNHGQIRSSEVSKGTNGSTQSQSHSQSGGKATPKATNVGGGAGNSVSSSRGGGSGGGGKGGGAGGGGQSGGGGGGNAHAGNAHSQKPGSPPGKPDRE